MYNDILYFNFCLLGLIVLFFSFLFMVVPSWYHKYLAPPFNKEILLLLLLLYLELYGDNCSGEILLKVEWHLYLCTPYLNNVKEK